MPAGRPLKIETPEIMQKMIDDYKSIRDSKSLPYTKISLVLHLGFADRHALDDTYIKNDKFSAIIKKVYSEIESSKIDSLYGDHANTTWTIFDFKCNHGWNDKKAEQNENDLDVVDFDFVEVE